MRLRYEYFGLAAAALLLLPVLFFPISPDLSIFISGGRALANGGSIYRDFVDLKPPLVYYFFALVYKIFGWKEFNIRIFDFAWQIATAFSVYHVTRKTTGPGKPAVAAAVIYSLSYTSLQYLNTFQVESLVCLPLAWLIYLQVSDRDNLSRLLLKGILIGLVCSMKYTFVVILPVFIFDELFRKEGLPGKRASKSLLLTIFSLVTVAITLLPLLDSQSRQGYGNILRYLSFYSNYPPLGISFFREALKMVGDFLGDNYSLLLVAAVLAGLYTGLSGRTGEPESRAARLKSSVVTLCALLSIALMLSVVSERKFIPYHFSRIYVPLSIIGGIGMIEIISSLARSFRNSGFYARTALTALIITGILFSPLPRWIAMAQVPLQFFRGENSYDSYFERSGNFNLSRVQQKQVASAIRQAMKPGDKVVIMGIGLNPIYHFSGAGRISQFAHSSYYTGTLDVKQWDRQAVDDINDAAFLVIQVNQPFKEINGHDMDTWTALHGKPQIWNYIDSNFSVYRTFPIAIVMKRKV